MKFVNLLLYRKQTIIKKFIELIWLINLHQQFKFTTSLVGCISALIFIKSHSWPINLRPNKDLSTVLFVLSCNFSIQSIKVMIYSTVCSLILNLQLTAHLTASLQSKNACRHNIKEQYLQKLEHQGYCSSIKIRVGVG